jgi:DNA modification methylase
MDWRHTREIQDAAEPLFGPPKQLCVWVKDNAGLGSFYRSRHELVFVFKKGSAKHVNNFQLGEHGRYRTNVWTYPGVNTFTGKGFELLKHHPTVKPTGLIADALRDCSRRNGLVLDPFAGSGTILVAAERTGRRARTIEIDPQYVDVAINRWQRVTGKQAVLAATGKTWDQVQAERAPDETVEV